MGVNKESGQKKARSYRICYGGLVRDGVDYNCEDLNKIKSLQPFILTSKLLSLNVYTLSLNSNRDSAIARAIVSASFDFSA